jgi:hypothetical protein
MTKRYAPTSIRGPQAQAMILAGRQIHANGPRALFVHTALSGNAMKLPHDAN